MVIKKIQVMQPESLSRWCFLLSHLPALDIGVVPNIPFVQNGIALRILNFESKRMCFKDFIAVINYFTVVIDYIFLSLGSLFYFSSGAGINHVHTGV